jgi:hypothetical protein
MAKFEYFYVIELGSGDARTVTGVIEAENEKQARLEMLELETRNHAGDYARIVYRPEGVNWKKMISVSRAIELPEETPGPLGRFSQTWCNAVWEKNQ